MLSVERVAKQTQLPQTALTECESKENKEKKVKKGGGPPRRTSEVGALCSASLPWLTGEPSQSEDRPSKQVSFLQR